MSTASLRTHCHQPRPQPVPELHGFHGLQRLPGFQRLRGLRTGKATAMIAVMMLSALPTQAQRHDDSSGPAAPVALLESVASMKLIFDGRSRPGKRIERKLENPVRTALNTWAPVAESLGLLVAVPERAPVLVLGHADDEFDIADCMLDVEHPGSASVEQKCAWIVLDYLLHERSAAFAALLEELAELDRKADPLHRRPQFVGSRKMAAKAVAQALDGTTHKQLSTWARRFKPNK